MIRDIITRITPSLVQSKNKGSHFLWGNGAIRALSSHSLAGPADQDHASRAAKSKLLSLSIHISRLLFNSTKFNLFIRSVSSSMHSSILHRSHQAFKYQWY